MCARRRARSSDFPMVHLRKTLTSDSIKNWDRGRRASVRGPLLVAVADLQAGAFAPRSTEELQPHWKTRFDEAHRDDQRGEPGHGSEEVLIAPERGEGISVLLRGIVELREDDRIEPAPLERFEERPAHGV